WRALLVAMLCAAPVAAQDTRGLEEELAQLRERVAVLEKEESSSPDPGEEPGGWRPTLPQVMLGGFADVNFEYRKGRLKEGDPPDPTMPWSGHDEHDEFFLGNLDLFLASQLSERFSFLSEILFEFEPHETEIDAERLLLRYEHADWLRVSAGRGHTAIGYWNKHFHHGAWLWTTATRPLIFEFEDDGGPLPLHFVGIEFSGVRDTELGLLEYNSVLANGRSDDPERVATVGDLNDGKMIAGALGFTPRLFPGLSVGANVLYEEIPKDSHANPAWERPIHELVAGGYVVFAGNALTVAVEGQYIHHGMPAKDYDSFGGYAQISYRLGGNSDSSWLDAMIPYYRFDWLSIADEDPFYRAYSVENPTGVPTVVDTRRHTVGIRYDWAAFVALKLEYRRLDSDVENSNTLALQAALAF
ncbi:MAG: hypothetical protein VCE43_16080, partial [Myxococcota bacterium]